MGMPLVLFRDCGGKVLLRYVAYIEQKDGMELILLIKSLCDYLVVRVKETAIVISIMRLYQIIQYGSYI